jgi:hypothetical protein
MDRLIEVLEHAEKACLTEFEGRKNSFVWAKTADDWKHKAEGIRFAIDTAKGMQDAVQDR